MLLTNGRVFNGRKFLKNNAVEIINGKIARIFSMKVVTKGAVDLKGKILSPGLIDIHTHAAASIDFLGIKTQKDVVKVKKAFLKQGVTSFVATTVYSPSDKKRPVMIKKLLMEKAGARCLGVYLEGPFISLKKKGAIKREFVARNAKCEMRSARKILKKYPLLRIMTVAPELPGADSMIGYLKKRGIVAAFGHSDAGNAGAKRGIKSGIRHVTHLFNGMRKWNDDDPAFKALLADKRVTVEVIADGRHLPPEILKMIYKKFGKDRIVLISDATGAKSFYDAAREAGTNLPLLELVRRMRRFCGLSAEHALQMATYNPARALSLKAGEIKTGYPAELAVFDKRLKTCEGVIAFK